MKPEIRPLAIKLYKVNSEQHVYLFGLKDMEVNKAQFLPTSWGPTLAERAKLKLIAAEK